MKIRDARPDELKGTSRGSRNPERDAMFDRAIRDAKAGKPKVIELDPNEKQVTIRAAINKRIKTTAVDGVKVRGMGKDRLVVESGSSRRGGGRRERRGATDSTSAG
jgi:hypothetical protein